MKHSAKEVDTGRILIIRLSAIGDVVRTLPALSTLRREYPNAHIAWAVEDKSRGILEGHPHLDEVIEFERRRIGSALKNPLRLPAGLAMAARYLRKIRSDDYDMVFDFHGILKSGIIAAASRSPRRVGFERGFVKEFSHLFTNKKVKPTDARLPRVERNLELLGPFVSPENVTDMPVLGITEKQRAKARAFIGETFGESRPLVAVHPGTSRNLKKWVPAHFAVLCDMLASSLGARAMITWGPGERADAERIRSLAKSRPEVAMQTDNILELAALLEACDLMIAVDSGPMHIGSAVGTPVVAVFGPTDVRINAPHWGAKKVVTAHIDCRPCDENCDFARCMEAVTPNDVFEAARELLGQTGATTSHTASDK